MPVFSISRLVVTVTAFHSSPGSCSAQCSLGKLTSYGSNSVATMLPSGVRQHSLAAPGANVVAEHIPFAHGCLLQVANLKWITSPSWTM